MIGVRSQGNGALVKLATAMSEVRLVASLITSLKPNGDIDHNTQIGDGTLGDWLDWLTLRMEKEGLPSSLEGVFQRVFAVAQDVVDPHDS